MAVGEGRRTAMVAIVLMLFLVLPRDMEVDAARYLVGDKINGWDFSIVNWTKPTTFTFTPGDELVFTYEVGKHDVVPVDDIEYTACGHALDKKVYTSGNDTFTLFNGFNYFISDFPNQCDSGMKIRIFAENS